MEIDKLAYSSSLRYKSPYLKSLFSVGALLSGVSSKAFLPPLFILITMAFVTIRSNRMGAVKYIRFLSLPFAFLILSTFTLLINGSDIPFDFVSLPFWGCYIGFERENVYQCLQLMLKALSAVSCLYFLSMTTTITDLLIVFKKLRFSHIFIELMLLIYRYLFVVFDMAGALVTAKNCRMGNRNFKISLASMGNIMAVLFMKSIKRSSELYDSMESRCYNGEINVLSRIGPAKGTEVLLTLFLLGVIIGVRSIYG